MSAITRFLQGLINVVGTAAQWAINQVAALFTGLWQAFLTLLDQLLAWVVALFDWAVLGAVSLFFAFIEALAGLLPAMPDEPTAVGAIGDALAFANRYFPVSEALTLGAIWGTIYGGMYLYKVYKALRGGG